MRRSTALLILAIFLNVLTFPAAGEQPPSENAKPPQPAPRRFDTNHEGVFGGQHVHYKAIVAENILPNSAGKPAASIFTTSYLRTDVPKGTVRPVMFVFNGGPGSASLWMHMGFVGPRRIDFTDVLKPETVPPFHIVDNEDSPLDVTDIVLIDPPGTGFSRILPEGKADEFYGVMPDAKASVDLIERWVRENNRWNSPKYILGESYGTIRAAVVARMAAGGPTETGNMEGLTLNGIILLGQALDMKSSIGEDTALVNLLPTLAATACYHGKVAANCSAETQAADAKKFAADGYLKALYAGANLPSNERDAVVSQLSTLTGLPADFIRSNNLRVSASAFEHELLKDKGEQVGAYDGRYVLPLTPSGQDPVADDPAMAQYVPGFVAAFNTYQHDELGVSLDDEYEAISFRGVNFHWDYSHGSGGEGSYAEDLSIAMRRNPHLRLMVGAGYYDLVTPLGSAEYVISHGEFPATATELHAYSSGHMPYLGSKARQLLAHDVRTFITGNQHP